MERKLIIIFMAISVVLFVGFWSEQRILKEKINGIHRILNVNIENTNKRFDKQIKFNHLVVERLGQLGGG